MNQTDKEDKEEIWQEGVLSFISKGGQDATQYKTDLSSGREDLLHLSMDYQFCWDFFP